MAGGYVTPQEFAQRWTALVRPKYRKYGTLMGQLVKRESGGKLHARNDGLNSNGTVDHGPLQVNDIWRNDPVVGPLFRSGAIYTVDGAIKAGERILAVQGLKAWSTHNPATDAKYIGNQNLVNVPPRHTAQPTASTTGGIVPGLPGFDKAGFEQAQKRFLVGGLIAKNHGTDSILFRTGLLTTQAPTAENFIKPGMLPAALAARTPPTGRKGNSPLTTPGSVPDNIRVLMERANKIDSKHFPYVWGGGHGRSGVPSGGIPGGTGGGVGLLGFDCSGAVAAVLGVDPRHSSQFAQWGKPGRAKGGRGVTVYANNHHVLMEINGHFWGTSSTNPRGGAGWIPRSAISEGYLAGFTARHL